MSWLIPISAVVLIAALGGAAWRVLARRETELPNLPEAPTEDDAQDDDPDSSGEIEITGETQTGPRVRRFLQTGSHRIQEPPSSASILRHDTQARIEEAEVAVDMGTLESFLGDVRDSLGADEAVFWRWSAERDALGPWAWSTPGTGRPRHFDMNAWGPLVKWAAEGRVMHFDADARVAVTRLAAAPVEHDGRLMGVLSVARAEGLDRGREHVKTWLPRHSAQIGRLVSLFEMRRDYARHMRQNQALLAAAHNVQGHKSQESLGRKMCETAVLVSSATDAALVRCRAHDARGWVQYTTPGFKHRGPFEVSPESLTATALTEGTLLLLDDGSRAGAQSLFADGDGGWTKGSLAVVPLKLDQRVMGGIVVGSDERGALTRDECRNIALLGALAATSLEMAWEIEEVSRRARTDALTGLANRGAFDEQLERLLTQADRFGHSVSLILADVDHFKKVNDNWGHEAGDRVLKSIAETLTEGVRAVDMCARFGGEELAILLPQTTLPGAVELADRLRRAVGAKPIAWNSEEIHVTISCGVACYPGCVLTKEALFAAADRAMYEAKSAGRNCVKSGASKPIGIAR